MTDKLEPNSASGSQVNKTMQMNESIRGHQKLQLNNETSRHLHFFENSYLKRPLKTYT